MDYLRKTSNYSKRIALSDPTHMMGITDLVLINMETLRINYGCYLEKNFTKLIRMNPQMVIILNCLSG